MSLSLLMGVVFLYYFITRNKENISNKHYKKTLKNLSKYALIIVIGLAIAMLWWFKPIFINHGQTSLNYTEALTVDYNQFSVQFSEIKNLLSQSLIHFNSIAGAIYSLLIITGIVCLFHH